MNCFLKRHTNPSVESTGDLTKTRAINTVPKRQSIKLSLK